MSKYFLIEDIELINELHICKYSKSLHLKGMLSKIRHFYIDLC